MRIVNIFALFLLLLQGQAAVAQTAVGQTIAVQTATQTAVARPGDKGFAVVELFTSEGCSSCPPADRLAARVLEENAGKNVYLLGYHVDYWDRLGWKDAFSSHEWSQRQNSYAGLLGLSSVYTPQVIVNGQAEFVGSDAVRMRRAIDNALTASPAATLALHRPAGSSHSAGPGKGQTIELDYTVTGEVKDMQLWLALVQKNAATAVKGGENAGAKLVHVNVVRLLHGVYPLHAGTGHEKLEVPAGLGPGDYEVVGFVQSRSKGAITAAAALPN